MNARILPVLFGLLVGLFATAARAQLTGYDDVLGVAPGGVLSDIDPHSGLTSVRPDFGSCLFAPRNLLLNPTFLVIGFTSGMTRIGDTLYALGLGFATPSPELLTIDRNTGLETVGGDTDGDTLCDDLDPCKSFANTLPLVISNFFSGIPDECLCGDFDGDGFYSATDADLINRVSSFLDPAYALTCGRRPEGTCGGDPGVSCF